jgi:transposase-like protein
MQIPIPRPTPSCSRFSSVEVPCTRCGSQMRLVLIEPRTAKLEQRTYFCTPCESGESFLLTI